MGPQDHLRALLDGFACTVCDERLSADRIRLLAQRDDLVFVEFECTGCGSTALGFITDGVADQLRARPEVDRLAGGAVVSSDDLLDMHDLLKSWTGDLVSLMDGPGAARTNRMGPGERQGLSRRATGRSA